MPIVRENGMKVYGVMVHGIDGIAVEFGNYDGLAGKDEAGLILATDVMYIRRDEWEQIKQVGDAYFDEVASKQGDPE